MGISLHIEFNRGWAGSYNPIKLQVLNRQFDLNSCIHNDNQEVEEDDNDQQEVNDGHSVADGGISIVIVIIIAKKF